MPLLTLILFSLISNFVEAQISSSCSQKDLSSSISQRDQITQGEIGWCYAFSFADLISQKIGKSVSPYDLAIRYNFFRGYKYEKGEFEAGISAQMSKLLKKEPWICSENNYPGAPADISLRYENQTYERLKALNPDDCKNAEYLPSGIFKNIKKISDVIEHVFKSRDFTEFIKRLNDQNCKDKTEISLDFDIQDRLCSWSDEKCQEPHASYIREQLDSGKAVGIDFNTSKMFKSDAGFWKTQTMHLKMAKNHTATIIGKGEKNGKCYYKIRDSAFSIPSSCEKIKIPTADIQCLEDYTYEVPENLILDSLISTIVVK